MSVLTHGNKTMKWRKKERFRILGVRMDNLRGLLGIRRMDKVPNARISQLCEMTKGVDEKGVERKMNDRITKRVYVWECTDGQPQRFPRYQENG